MSVRQRVPATLQVNASQRQTRATNKYGPVVILGWVISVREWVGFQIMAAFGSGMIPACRAIFPVLAPLPVLQNAAALGLSTFFCTFAQFCLIRLIAGQVSPYLAESAQGSASCRVYDSISLWRTDRLCGDFNYRRS
ncbi:hypothetical protein PYCCODRAFT_457726 [Trametes coccinea BRFM310]|uniref:Uncharacterized protein n=1 Tax=Trametes coccinea (strain BRFM310) TaxID=1353009 RepID=A0A1Y2IMR8_TRAC3|nr:hypothetical protein PYCCODRAFT_457726 [Trametes coccinea BRFM310]